MKLPERPNSDTEFFAVEAKIYGHTVLGCERYRKAAMLTLKPGWWGGSEDLIYHFFFTKDQARSILADLQGVVDALPE